MPPLPVSTGHHSASTPPARMGRGFGGFMGVGLQSPAAGKSHRRVTACTPAGGEVLVDGLWAPVGGASLLDIIVGTPTRRGPTFVRTKVGKTRLGRCPKTPVAGCAGYGLIFDGSPKSIRTAHRIAPKVATGVSALSPHPLSRWRERGPDGRVKSGE